MRAFFAVGLSPKADAIAAQQAWLLSQHTGQDRQGEEEREKLAHQRCFLCELR
jgi:hypothetical protein